MLRKWIALLLALCLMPFAALEGFAEPSEVDDYDRAFEQGYVDEEWQAHDRSEQMSSSAYRAMLEKMIGALSPESLEYFEGRVTDYDCPLTRELGLLMSWYGAVAVGADGYNTGSDFNPLDRDQFGEDDESVNRMLALMPEVVNPNPVTVGDMTWDLEHGAAMFWNVWYISPISQKNVIGIDPQTGDHRLLDPFTVEDAVCAITRIQDFHARITPVGPENGLPSDSPYQHIMITRAQDILNDQKARLGEDLAAAKALGVVDDEMIARADEIVTEREAAAMVQAAFQASHGQESTFLSAILNDAEDEHLNDPACRFWFAILVGNSFDEWFSSRVCDGNWHDFVYDTSGTIPQICASVPSGMVGILLQDSISETTDRYGNPQSLIGHITSSGNVFEVCLDVGLWLQEPFTGQIPSHNSAEPTMPLWAVTCLYDRTNGEKVLMDYGDGTFRPFDEMTVGDAATAALRYARSIEPDPEFVPIAEVGAFDESIITPELLSRETNLPANDCTHIPSNWHGAMEGKPGNLYNLCLGTDTDHSVYETDLDAFADCGFNFVRLSVSFSRLQGMLRPPYGQAGCVNMVRLRELDQMIAWCIERDMHVQLRASDQPEQWMTPMSPGFDFFAWSEEQGFGPLTDEEIAGFAEFWRMIARRYADIPNEYISFTIFGEPAVENDEDYVRRFKPAVDAIRAVTPNRTIFADVVNTTPTGHLTGEGMAQLGVALSSHFYKPLNFISNQYWTEEQYTQEYMESVQWPGEWEDVRYYLYHVEPIAAGMIDYGTVKASAEKYGVGVFIGEFGILVTDESSSYMPFRYSDETIRAYYADCFQNFEEEGVSWCFGGFNAPYMPVQIAPVYDTEYVRYGRYYLDTMLRDFLRRYAVGE